MNINTKFKSSNIQESLNEFKNRENILNELLNSKEYMYNDAYTQSRRADFFNLKDSCGIYHFFYIENDEKYSLYIGKASFGEKGNWCLSKRINQHFQESQRNTLPGKISSLSGCDIKKSTELLCKYEVYVQFYEIYIKDKCKKSYKDINKEIQVYEKFCINILRPIFTDK